MANYRGKKTIDPLVEHDGLNTYLSDEYYEIVVRYIGEGTNTADDRLQAAATRIVTSLRTPGRRRAFDNWYRSHVKRNPVI